jgi:RNA polymerase-binding protein DksA
MDTVGLQNRTETARLEEERRQTIEKIEHLRVDLHNLAEPSADEADVDAYEREKTWALIQTLERKLDSIDHALQSAQSGTYGLCETCGGRIDPARLEILPQAVLCLNCQREFERRNKRGRRR